METKKRFLVTSALPYVNNIPHLGNLLPVVSGDVFTRFLKLKGYEVVSVLGTDEHGTTTEVKARKEGKTPKEIVDKYFKIHKKIYEWFQCNYTFFGRTSSYINWLTTWEIFEDLYVNGYITEQDVEQLYCEKDKLFLADRYVEGTCPYCDYEFAKGDQCENCGRLLNATELKDAKCTLCGSSPKIKKVKHLFLRLDKLQDKVSSYVEDKRGKWKDNVYSIAKSWLSQGLLPRDITRNISWGIPVPLEGFEDQVFYSWFDAPIGYISIVREHSLKEWTSWWLSKDVELVQFMGKDNVPFHTIMFPAMLLGTSKPYKVADRIESNEYLMFEGMQFSKSKGIGVFGDVAMNSGIESDAWRFYLMANRPEKSDTNFTWNDFKEKINNVLVANFVNLAYRVLKFVEQHFPDGISQGKEYFSYDEIIDEILTLYFNAEFRQAISKIMELSSQGNKLFQEKEPWKLVNNSKEEVASLLAFLGKLVRDLALLIYPVTPTLSKRILYYYGLDEKDFSFNLLNKPLNTFKVSKVKPLFRKIEDSTIENLKNLTMGNTKQGNKGIASWFEALDLRVARVEKVLDHPNADKLYILKLDLGTFKKQILAGLKAYYSKEELEGKKIIIVNNLKPRKMRGELSQGMLLAAHDESSNSVGVLLAPDSAEAGERVSLGDMECKGDKEIDIEYLFKNRFESLGNRVKLKGTEKYLNVKGKEIKVDKEVKGLVS